MKCDRCGGLIVDDQYEPGKRKCFNCGRRVKDPRETKERMDMETTKKVCSKCLKELPLTTEFFNKNANNKDGFEGKCKNCRQKYFEDYRAGKRIRAGASKPAAKKDPVSKRPYRRRDLKKVDPPEPLTKASPAEILIALRKGMAAEIVEMINEKYDL